MHMAFRRTRLKLCMWRYCYTCGLVVFDDFAIFFQIRVVRDTVLMILVMVVSLMKAYRIVIMSIEYSVSFAVVSNHTHPKRTPYRKHVV